VTVDEVNAMFIGGRFVKNSGWISQLPAEISSASDLKTLHIRLFAKHGLDLLSWTLDERHSRTGGLGETTTLLGQIKSKASIKAGIDLWTARLGRTSMSYYALLDKTTW
jgi:hypothetical protein